MREPTRCRPVRRFGSPSNTLYRYCLLYKYFSPHRMRHVVGLVGLLAASGSAWMHDWDSPASAWWGYGAMNGAIYSDSDVAFIASTYRVVVISACLGASNASVAMTIMGVSARIKALNPNIKVLQYWNMQQWACYNTAEPA